MKLKVPLFIFCLAVATGTAAQEVQSPKPGIAVNGVQCLIQNTIWSCVPVTCDSVVIVQGDSVEFCTFQEIYLNTDTAYWYECHFIGCGNIPDSIRMVYPAQTPICYWPRWDSAGTFQVEILYNGWLSAYPQSDCYVQGPSRWYINVIVLPAAGVSENSQQHSMLTVYPNPGNGIFELRMTGNSEIESITLTDSFGNIIEKCKSKNVDLTHKPAGLYFVHALTVSGTYIAPVVNIHE